MPHAWAAVGLVVLPMGISVQIEMVAEIDSTTVEAE